jgi:NAD kinase
MFEEITPISPFTVTLEPIVYDAISIKRISVDITEKSASIEVQLFSNNNLRDIKLLNMSGDNYLNWGTDDSYVITWVMKELGFTSP